MVTFDELAQRYIDTWNEAELAARSAAVEALFAADARYVDPMVAVEGRQDIAATIGAVQMQFPCFTFRLGGPVDWHHRQARFTSRLTP